MHIRLEGQLLHVLVFAHLDKALAALIGGVPKILHDAKHNESQAVLFHKALASQLQAGRILTL